MTAWRPEPSAPSPRSRPRFRATLSRSFATPSSEGAAHLAELRAFVERFPRQAALKRLLGRQGVPVGEDVRAPLRGLTTRSATSSTLGTRP